MLLLACLTNKEIAVRLDVSSHTVRNILHAVYGRLEIAGDQGADKRGRALVRALELDEIVIEDVFCPWEYLPPRVSASGLTERG